ncbi:unnamed protein product [Aureobasidium mustum]|uniref:Uncharacterized protein n=1 Tax=Aureobasidium mustum TaxID=2773714 RepID=A0A9N8JI38_9PEZI|nr:unnamed protein product [Aureobasidium mustum]
MSTSTVSFGALSAVGLHSGEVQLLPSPMSVLTARCPAAIPYTPHQAPEAGTASTINGFELETIEEEDQDLALMPTATVHTPALSQASFPSDLEDEIVSSPELQRYFEAMATRIEQLVEENELLAEELRRIEKKRKEKKDKKQRKSKEEEARHQTDVMRDLLRAVTAVMTPMPEGSPGRFVLMAIEAFFLRERMNVS